MEQDQDFYNFLASNLWPGRDIAVILFPITELAFVICYSYIIKTILSKHPYKGII